MAIPKPAHDFVEQQQPFLKLKECLNQLQQKHPEQSFDTLSMGMSQDLEAAIASGSTMVRIGTALFGARQKK